MSKKHGSPHLHAVTIKVSPLKESYSLIPFFSASLWSSHRFASGTCVSKERKSSDSRTFQWAIGRCENVFPTSTAMAWLRSLQRWRPSWRQKPPFPRCLTLIGGCIWYLRASKRTTEKSLHRTNTDTEKWWTSIFFWGGWQRCTWWITG